MTASSVQLLLGILESLESVIQEAGPSGIPSGHLYASLMGKMNLNQYNSLIGILKEAGKITETGHVLRHKNPILRSAQG